MIRALQIGYLYIASELYNGAFSDALTTKKPCFFVPQASQQMASYQWNIPMLEMAFRHLAENFDCLIWSSADVWQAEEFFCLL